MSDDVFFDADGAVNGSFSWHPSVGNSYINLAPGDWIFKVIDEDLTEKATYLHVKKLPPTNYSISGKVTVPTNTEFIWIEAGYEDGAGWHLYAAFTDSGGTISSLYLIPWVTEPGRSRLVAKWVCLGIFHLTNRKY